MTSPSTLVRTESLGGGALAQAMMAGRAPKAWYEPMSADPTAWVERCRAVRQTVRGSEWLEALWPAIDARGAAARRLRESAERGVVITTGQQPGLFGGPIYTWSKAVTALALADALQAAIGVPVAPIFWAATDDTDFAEAASTWISLPDGGQAIRLDSPPPAIQGHVALASVPLGDVNDALSQLERGAGSSAYREAFTAAAAFYGPEARTRGVTIGGAYVGLLRRILEPLGIAVIDAAHEAVRTQAFPLLRQALGESFEIDAALSDRTSAITTLGYDPQVALVPELSLVFSYDPDTGEKRRIPLGESVAMAQSAKVGWLSPNVLLRPIVERAILPTVAYAAGPAEVAYFAQVSAVAAALRAPAPLAVPRWSGTIVEPHVAKILDRQQLTVEALSDPHGAEGRVAKAALPAGILEHLEHLNATIDSTMAQLAKGEATALVPAAVPEGARQQLRYRVDRLARRYVAAGKRLEETTMREIATARAALYPGGVRQERVLNFIPMLARQGPAVIDAMRHAAAQHAAALVGVSAGVR